MIHWRSRDARNEEIKEEPEIDGKIEENTMPVYTLLIALLLSLPVCVHAAEFRGLIEPHRIIKLGSPQPGVLASVEVERGDFVKKGQVLATLQREVEKANVEVAKYRAEMEAGGKGKAGSHAFFEGKKERIERLHRKQLAAQAEMDEAETNRHVAEMQWKEAQENKALAGLEYKRSVELLDRMVIRSPIDGVVMERFLSPGEYVEKDPVLKLAQIDPLNVEVIMPASQLLSVRVGMRANVTPEPPVHGTYSAVVKVVDRVVDAASGTFGVRLELPNPGHRLPAGLKSKVIFSGK
jgi:RND family efflux transporter MFP subunit